MRTDRSSPPVIPTVVEGSLFVDWRAATTDDVFDHATNQKLAPGLRRPASDF